MEPREGPQGPSRAPMVRSIITETFLVWTRAPPGIFWVILRSFSLITRKKFMKFTTVIVKISSGLIALLSLFGLGAPSEHWGEGAIYPPALPTLGRP